MYIYLQTVVREYFWWKCILLQYCIMYNSFNEIISFRNRKIRFGATFLKLERHLCYDYWFKSLFGGDKILKNVLWLLLMYNSWNALL